MWDKIKEILGPKQRLPTREELLAILASGNEPAIVQPARELDKLAVGAAEQN